MPVHLFQSPVMGFVLNQFLDDAETTTLHAKTPRARSTSSMVLYRSTNILPRSGMEKVVELFILQDLDAIISRRKMFLQSWRNHYGGVVAWLL